MQKRLGDGFYEQRLVREQIAQLTGRRFLPGYTNDEAQFQALMDKATTFAQAHQLRPGIALSAEQMAALTSDIVWLVEKDVTLPNGQVTRALVPQVYVQVRDGDLKPDGSLLGGDRVKLSLAGDLTNSGTIAGRELVNLRATNINNLGGTIAGGSVNVNATRDIHSDGGQIQAENALSLSAGNDITIASTTRSSSNAQGSRTDIDRIAGLSVSRDDGQIVVAAGRNLTLKGATVQQGTPAASTSESNTTATTSPTTGHIVLAAGNDIRLDTVTATRSDSVNWGGGNYRREASRTDVASSIEAAGAVDIVAGRDIVSRGAQVATRDGDIQLNASRDVTLSTAESHVSVDEAHRHTRRGFLSSTTTSSRHTLNQTTQHGTLLSGNRVNVQTGQDIKISGSDIASSQGTVLDAARNVSIDAATNTRDETHLQQKRTSGLMSSGGFGLTIGNRSLKTNSDTTTTTASASTIGSTQGDVTIKAGDKVTQTGSNVIAPQGDVTIAARNVAITEARHSQTTVTETQFKQSGLTVAVSNPIVTAVQTAKAMSEAASNTNDSRMKALAAANTAMAAKNAVDASSRDGNAVDKLGGIQLSISLGTAKSDSHSVVRNSEAVASSVSAGGDVTITALGDKAHSDLTLQGSQIAAGEQAKLVAEHALKLQAASNTQTQTSSNSNSSASVGLILDSKGGLGVNASASQGRGNADGQDQRWTNATVNGGQQVILQSGMDTAIKGGVVSAPQVTVAAGDKLGIESLQDTSTYTSRQKQLGGSATIGTAPSANVNAAKSNINSTYNSVTEQSGIKAGDGGFDVKVAGDTTLKGGVISSTQAAVDANRNQFSAGGQVATADIENHAHYQAESVSVNLGTGFSAQGKLAPTGTGVGFGKDSDSAASTTHAGISGVAGDTTVRTGDKAAGIAKIFDADKVQKEVAAQTQITQMFSTLAPKAVATYADGQIKALNDKLKTETDPQQRAALLTEKAQWDEGGTYRVLLHTAAGGLVGDVSGAAGAGTAGLAAPKLNEMQANLEDALIKAGMNATLAKGAAANVSGVTAAGIGGAVGGTTGAGAGLSVDANNRQLHPHEKARIKQLASEDPRKEARLTAAACAMVRCYAEYPVDSQAYLQLKQLALIGASDALSNERNLLSQQKGMFDYSTDGLLSGVNKDAFKQINNTHQITTRAIGFGQTGLGALGFAASVTSAPVICATGIGCVTNAVAGTMSMDAMYSGAKQLFSGNSENTFLIQGLNSLGLSPQASALVEMALGFGSAATAGKVAVRAIDQSIALNKLSAASYENFTTNGVKATAEVMQMPQVQALVREIQAGNAGISIQTAIKYAQDYIVSGSTIPQASIATPGSTLIKVVPKGDGISPYSGYWISPQQAQAIAVMTPEKASQVLGLPATQAARISNSGIDFYAITAKAGVTPNVFVSKIASTAQGAVIMPGGAQQVIVPNRSLWTQPIAVNPFNLSIGGR
jgi:filamentous hemagglutinin